jgi:predicted unusual protein kinase regulating ubiquinone biosynthesis (AarF/ABC1/UbiB family)
MESGPGKRIPTSLASRGLEFLKMGARIAAKSGVGGEAATKRLEQAEILVEGLSKLKGAAMKLGQTMSVELRDLLPPEVVEALSKLQDQGTTLTGAQVRAILAEEWGAERLAKLEGFVEKPLASASIGQVHAARWNGEDIVLKVQFPGISRTIDSDIQGLGLLLKGMLAVTKRKIAIEPLLEELGAVFRQETDYQLEADFLREYGSNISAFPGYRVPRVVDELVTSRVLAMSRERGLKPLDWVKLRQPSSKVRNQVGQRMLDLYEIEFFQMGLVQTDPNFANFLIDDSHDRENPVITLLDFGAVKRYEPEFRARYREVLRLSRESNEQELLEKIFSLGLLDRAETGEGKDAMVRLLRASLSPFDVACQPFRFIDADYAREMRELAMALTQACRVSPPPRAIIFLHRKLGGVFNLLKAMEVELDLTDYWKRIVLESKPVG